MISIPSTRQHRRDSADATTSVADMTLVAERPVTSCPVRSGVCLPEGAVHSAADLVLHDGYDRPVPMQPTVLATWPDGSVKWLLVESLAAHLPGGTSTWSLQRRTEDATHDRFQAEPPTSSNSLIDVQRTDDRLELFTVPSRDEPALAAGLRLVLCTSGRDRRVEWTDVDTLAAGPVVHRWRFDGTIRKAHGMRVRVLVTSYDTTGLVRLDVRLHNPNRARHRGGYWDLGDPGSIAIDACELHLDVDEPAFDRVAWRADRNDQPTRSTSVAFHQESSGGENWDARTHVDRTGFVPTRFRGCRITADGNERRIDRASPLVTLERDDASLTVGVAEFWEKFPTSLDVSTGSIRVGLLPADFDGQHELQPGERLSRTIWLARGGVQSLDGVHVPISVSPSRETVAAANVLPWCDADPTRLRRIERYLGPTLDGPTDFFAKRESADEYGWRNFGELWADHEGTHYDGPAPIVSHYNNQFDAVFGFLAHHLRTADPRWRRLADPLARHVVDVDTYHTDRDRACYSGGLFWHTDHYVDAATATHRTYSIANNDRSPGGGPACEHGYTTGLLHHFYLTGDADSREAVIGLAEWVLAMDDGSRTPFALVDDGPTGLATKTGSPDYHGPGRGVGNSVNTLVDAWTLTGDRRYIDAAETFIRRAVHPHDDVDARELLDFERRWSYTVFLASLAKYLERKLAVGENDAMYAYGVASLLRYAEWMADHERPYFDQPEKLEFPTETWAAQEFRKANALRLAARWADEPLRSRLLERGRSFSERAWADLESFDSRHVTRAVVILMTEGLRDAHLATHNNVRHPAPIEQPDFGEPETFVPQRERFKRAIKSPGGLLRIAGRMLDVRRWPRLLDNLRRHL